MSLDSSFIGKENSNYSITINGKWIAYSHTFFSSVSFFVAFFLGVLLHYHKIVQNEHFGYPDEWFPSVSATIGDRYPERSLFQIFIAVTAGPRFLLLLLWYLLAKNNMPRSRTPLINAILGTIRTVTCGGWVYITSTDDHDWHDIFMISYILLTAPWNYYCIKYTPSSKETKNRRKLISTCFWVALFPLVFFFVRHKAHQVPGAYTIYAMFEWLLIALDVMFDYTFVEDFSAFDITIGESSMPKRHSA